MIAQPEQFVQEVTAIVHRKPACLIELEVTASPSLVSQAHKEATKKVGKEAQLPGFRKGKAPNELILKRYPQVIESEWHKKIADLSFAAAQSQVRIPVLNGNSSISFDLKSHSLKEGAKVIFSFETEPEVPSVDPSLFQSQEEPSSQVEEKQIDEAIRQLQYYYAKWTPVTDRGVQEGDTIVIDLDTLDGEPQKVFHQVRFEVATSRMADWMKRLVLGAKTGDVLEGVSEADETASEEEKKEFSPKRVRLTLHKVELAHLPTVDDEFARTLGVPDVAALRVSIQGKLQDLLEQDRQEKRRKQVNDFLMQRYDFELPLSLIKAEQDHRLKEALHDSSQRKSYESSSEEEKKKVHERMFLEASQSIKLFYLARQVIRDANIPVTHSEVEQAAIQLAQGQKLDPEHLPRELYALALSTVILRKAQDYLLKK